MFFILMWCQKGGKKITKVINLKEQFWKNISKGEMLDQFLEVMKTLEDFEGQLDSKFLSLPYLQQEELIELQHFKGIDKRVDNKMSHLLPTSQAEWLSSIEKLDAELDESLLFLNELIAKAPVSVINNKQYPCLTTSTKSLKLKAGQALNDIGKISGIIQILEKQYKISQIKKKLWDSSKAENVEKIKPQKAELKEKRLDTVKQIQEQTTDLIRKDHNRILGNNDDTPLYTSFSSVSENQNEIIFLMFSNLMKDKKQSNLMILINIMMQYLEQSQCHYFEQIEENQEQSEQISNLRQQILNELLILKQDLEQKSNEQDQDISQEILKKIKDLYNKFEKYTTYQIESK